MIRTEKGYPTPLGASRKDGGVNFALFSAAAPEVTLCLFEIFGTKPSYLIPLNKTGNIWHVHLPDLKGEWEYAYRISGLTLHDPYSKSLATSHTWGEPCPSPRSRLILDKPFDWGKERPGPIPFNELIIYEMHVRAFTQDRSSGVKHPGTFLGIIEKIPYLKKLGVNAVELLPIFEFNECEYQKKNLYNFWGYSTINFFSPMNRYALSDALTEFKTLVKALHANGIEVILDVVYNHTAEGGKDGPFLSFRGIDNKVYYLLSPSGENLDYTGTGNTFNANHPVVTQLILDSLRYWVSEMHVDGFRFDLASALTRGKGGAPLTHPHLIEAINHDPVLSNVKLISESWDAAGLYQVGHFPGLPRWSEWNGKYRDVVRRFIKGTEHHAGAFATALCGSSDLYQSPQNSINFVTSHDGFSLRDLVTYQSKHNLANGEFNHDGTDQNDSWNCGVEGPTSDPAIIALRERQIRNFLTALFLSLGVPMLVMGDEYGHTRRGNNNPWCQDNELNYFCWNHEPSPFIGKLIALRKSHPIFRSTRFLTPSDITWHGHQPNHPDWNSRFVAYTLSNLYIAFNAHFTPATLTLPPGDWTLLIDTSIPNAPAAPVSQTYTLPPYASLVLKQGV